MNNKITVNANYKATVKPKNKEYGVIHQGLRTTKEVTIEEFNYLMINGTVWCPGVYNGSRSNTNWIKQSVFALDFDDGITPEEVLNRLKEVNLTCNSIYTTFSDSPVKRKFRVVFFLDEEVVNPDTAIKFNKAMMKVFATDDYNKTAADKQCKDLARLFNPGKEIIYTNSTLTTLNDFNDLLTPFFEVNTTPSKVFNKKSTNTNYKGGNDYHSTDLIVNFNFDRAIEDIMIMKDFNDGQWLEYHQFLGLATNLMQVEGGLTWMEEIMIKNNAAGLTNYNDNNFSTLQNVVNKVYLHSFKSFSPHAADSNLINIRVYHKLNDNVIKRKGNVIEIPASINYLSDLDGFELPYGVFNKKTTGCGGTTLAMENDSPYIITVPLVSLIDNKVSQSANLFGIHGELNNDRESLIAYLKTTDCPKIMVTYDSFSKITEWLEELYDGNYKNDFKVLVDEYHMLLTEYSYRDNAIRTMMKEVKTYNYYTFMTATPFNNKYKIEYFNDLPYTELNWENSSRIKPIRHATTKPYQHMANIIKKFISAGYKYEFDGIGESNELYIFINSIKGIASIIEQADLTTKEVKIVCSNNRSNRDRLDGYTIGKSLDESKPVTFITSKAFVGADFYSKNGMTFIVSNRNEKNTLLDIGTHISQISGRIRNIDNPFKGLVFHIFNTLGTVDLNNDEWLTLVEERKANSLLQIDDYNKKSNTLKNAFRKRMTLSIEDDYIYYNDDKDELEYDQLKEFNQQFDYHNTQSIYKDGVTVREAYLRNGFDVSVKQSWNYIETKFLSEKVSVSFKTYMKEYIDKIEEFNAEKEGTLKSLSLSFDIKSLLNDVPDLKKYSALPLNILKHCVHNKKKLNQALYDNSPECKEALTFHVLNEFKTGEFYSNKEVKAKLTAIYNQEKCSIKPKVDTLNAYIECLPMKRRIDGKLIRGIMLT